MIQPTQRSIHPIQSTCSTTVLNPSLTCYFCNHHKASTNVHLNSEYKFSFFPVRWHVRLDNIHGTPCTSGNDPAVRLDLVFLASTRFFLPIFSLFCPFFYLLQGVLVALSLTRIFLILKVSKSQLERNSFSWMLFSSADRVQPAGP